MNTSAQVQTPEKASADLEALSDLCTPWCIRVAATLRIADHIAAGITDVGKLAVAAGCDADALHNVLGHLVREGVFEEAAPGQFALNDTARGLIGPPAHLDLEGIGGRFAGAWSTLLDYTRTGTPGYAGLFGLPFWEDVAAHPDLAESLDAFVGPVGHGIHDQSLRIPGGWASIGTIVDVGGGTGTMLAEILRQRPDIRATLVDHPGMVERSREIFEAAGVASRVTTVGQSFFDPLPAGADLYLLRSVLNDWPDKETEAILRRCAEAARPNGRVVVFGGVTALDVGSDVTLETVLLGGRTNTLAEFGSIAYAAGLLCWGAEWPPSGSVILTLRPV